MLKREQVWLNYFGNASSGYDYAGRQIFRNRNDWNIEHVNPLRSDAYSNLIPAHKESNSAKANNSSWNDNGYNFQFFGQDGDYKYGIKRKKVGQGNDSWKIVTPKYFKK
ncbi:MULTISPECIES: HNH endonuclease domain-containing protein [unclassified Mycoplasma]|uniref:HNH endonuclease domain-containing protein n=1 Tax=unclassified Mycoplasma TaxID=2683645 RepID=UPI00216B0DB2|nr:MULTISPECIES: HNH endonuclease domain-containing protein [unclassified Mycoplasma]MCS4537013.1 hypothetical protein [Mycoplasma sp. CSL7475-4]MCT4469384.1 hypothetical protein [Mycoplasma sp. HS2188]